jgi:hypothetical protein
MALVFVPILVVLVFLPGTALAYMDPGSGSALMTAIIGTLIAVAMAVKTYWYKLRSLFVKDSSDDSGSHN